MIAFLAGVVLSQVPSTMSAEEIWQRLEAPVSLRTDPTRLSNALDQIGGMVGVRIRCDAALQPAIVVVGVRGKPAKEIVQHLVNGIGATTFVQTGVLHIGMKQQTDEQTEKQKELEIKAIDSSLEARAKSMKIDDPIDPTIAPRVAGQAMMGFQIMNGGNRYFNSSFYNSAAQSPSQRATVGILRALGGTYLRPENDKPKVITMKSVTEKESGPIREVLAKLETEQEPWAAAFTEVQRIAEKSEQYYIAEDLLARSISIKGSKPDNFRISITTQPWGRQLSVQILSGGEVLFETYESLPRQRVYTEPVGTHFNVAGAKDVRVDLDPKVTRLEQYRLPTNDNKPREYDWNLMKMVADTWRNEPISFTRAQPMADVALKLNLNLVTYLSDGLVTQLAYNYYSDTPKTLPGDQVLSLTGYSGVGQLRKKDDWLLGYSGNPEQYLSNQIDRPALGRFLSQAIKPGALSFEQFLAARKEMGNNQLNLARQLARFLRPGFDSLNPVNLEALDMIAMLRPGQLSQARSSGILISSLPPELEQKMRMFVGYQRRRSAVPDDSIDAPPTMNEIRQSKLFLEQSSKQGVIFLEGQTSMPRSMYVNYAYYNFQDFESFRNYTTVQQVLQRFANRASWACRQDTYMFRIEVKRKRSQAFGTTQYVTDVAQNPLTMAQAGDLVQRYFAN